MKFRSPAGWSASLVALVGVTLAVGLPVGGYYAYRTYDYIEHDNDFCMSCHLMSGPFEAFARSEHRGLGCKACHQPTLVGRSEMALTQVVDQPEELASHAAVSDEICTSCHVDGDPEKWRLIAESAGHRVHLESTDPALDEVTCVGCHSSSIHEFSATDQTCAQSGCHTDTEIHLGRMGDFTIHCVACHAFRAPLPAESSPEQVSAALRPDANECLSCHVMRAMVDVRPDEPHGGVCASCHNPHTQETAAEARQTCGNVGCHETVEGTSPFHLGIAVEVLQDCVACHSAHNFEIDGSDCRSCHTEPAPSVESPLAIRSMDHEVHTSVDCVSCHATEGSHGPVTVVTADDCQTCHHDASTDQECVQCHEDGAGFPATVQTPVKPMRLSVGENTSRALPFDHDVHATQDCATCHSGVPPQLDAVALDCTSCHQDHHTPESACLSCHVEAPASAHPVAQVHVGCSGSGCHTETPFAPAAGATLPRTRDFCLACHQELQDHRVEQTCIDCHAMPSSEE